MVSVRKREERESVTTHTRTHARTSTATRGVRSANPLDPERPMSEYAAVLSGSACTSP